MFFVHCAGSGETRTYRKTVRELLDKGQILQETSNQPIKVTVTLPDVKYEQNTYHVILVKSNFIDIEINPSLPQP